MPDFDIFSLRNVRNVELDSMVNKQKEILNTKFMQKKSINTSLKDPSVILIIVAMVYIHFEVLCLCLFYVI